jgi:hypothetical protein
MNGLGTYAHAAAMVRAGGGVIFPTFYGENYNVTDQAAFDIVPSPDRGPFIVTGITGLPFVTTNLARTDRVQIRAGGNDLQFAPFLASAFTPGAQLPQGIDSCLNCPIVVPAGGSLFIRNNVEGAAGVAVAGQITVSGFHTDARGQRIINRYGQPWVVPVVNDHAALAQTDIQFEVQMQAGVVEITHLVDGFQTTPILFSSRIRGVEIIQGATVLGDPAFAFNTPTSTGNELFAKASPGDGFTLRTVYAAAANNAYKANLWTRRIYRQPNQACN